MSEIRLLNIDTYARINNAAHIARRNINLRNVFIRKKH